MKRNWIYWFVLYSGATDAEVEAAKKLGLPVYLAPTL